MKRRTRQGNEGGGSLMKLLDLTGTADEAEGEGMGREIRTRNEDEGCEMGDETSDKTRTGTSTWDEMR